MSSIRVPGCTFEALSLSFARTHTHEGRRTCVYSFIEKEREKRERENLVLRAKLYVLQITIYINFGRVTVLFYAEKHK